jgi:hypothetical protein
VPDALGVEKSTRGGPASRTASSTSKNCSSVKWKFFAMTFDGNDWIRLL